ncbi:MFS transporter [Oceaniglobus roseus]|uniref:MFS transporter n=1 Tax=Oceaniglobus roseus TaxID=1737570 RepID=UPI000C7F1FD4|nr:MFS transporter [Kandeliimicrobium roseum]
MSTYAASIGPYQSLIAVRVFGFSDGQYALIYCTGAALSLAAAMVVGVVTDRTARRRTMARFMAGAGLVGAFGVGLVQTPLAFVVAHTLFFPAAATLFGQLFAMARLAGSIHPQAERVAIQTSLRAVFCLPWLVVLPIWALVFQGGVELLSVYLVCGTMASITLAIFLFAWPKDGSTRWKDERSGLSIGAALGELANGPVLSRAVLLAMMTGSVTLYMILIGLVLNGAPGRDESDVSLFVGIVAGLEVPFMLMLPALTLRFGITRVLTGASLLYAAFLATLPYLGATPAVWLLLLPAGIGASVLVSQPLLYLQDLLGRRPGMGGSLISLVQLGAQVFAAGVFALGTALGGYQAAAVLGALAAATAGITLWSMDRRGLPVQA